MEVVALRFCNGPHGKPSLAGDDAPTISFNLSHSDKLALIAVSPQAQLGVDIEQLRVVDDAEVIARSLFAPAEEAALAGVAERENEGSAGSGSGQTAPNR